MVKSLSELLAARPAAKSRPTNPRYARVVFELRQHFEITATECLFVDVVSILSRKSGWCFASRQYLANLLGISTRTLQRMIQRLSKGGIIEIHPDDARRVRPTQRWIQASK